MESDGNIDIWLILTYYEIIILIGSSYYSKNSTHDHNGRCQGKPTTAPAKLYKLPDGYITAILG